MAFWMNCFVFYGVSSCWPLKVFRCRRHRFPVLLSSIKTRPNDKTDFCFFRFFLHNYSQCKWNLHVFAYYKMAAIMFFEQFAALYKLWDNNFIIIFGCAAVAAAIGTKRCVLIKNVVFVTYFCTRLANLDNLKTKNKNCTLARALIQLFKCKFKQFFFQQVLEKTVFRWKQGVDPNFKKKRERDKRHTKCNARLPNGTYSCLATITQIMKRISLNADCYTQSVRAEGISWFQNAN